MMWDKLRPDVGLVALSDEFVMEKGLSTAQRFPWDHKKGIYVLNGYHNLHCIVCPPTPDSVSCRCTSKLGLLTHFNRSTFTGRCKSFTKVKRKVLHSPISSIAWIRFARTLYATPTTSPDIPLSRRARNLESENSANAAAGRSSKRGRNSIPLVTKTSVRWMGTFRWLIVLPFVLKGLRTFQRLRRFSKMLTLRSSRPMGARLEMMEVIPRVLRSHAENFCVPQLNLADRNCIDSWSYCRRTVGTYPSPVFTFR